MALREPLSGIKTVLPVASGGRHPGSVPDLLEIFGKDFVIQASGGIHGHREGTISGARAMRQAVDAAIQGIPLDEYAKDRKELKIPSRIRRPNALWKKKIRCEIVVASL